MDKKLGLINIHNDSARISSFQGKYISLASMKLAGYLLQNGISEDNIHIFPTDYAKNTQEIVKGINEEINKLLLDYIGFTSYVWNSDKTIEIIEGLLEINNKIKVIIGGPNSINANIKDDNIIKVIGKGEDVLFDILKNSNDIEKSEDGFYIQGNNRRIDSHVGDIKYGSYYSEEVLDRIKGLESMDNNFGWYETSSGCPYKCGFCAYDFEKLGIKVNDKEKVVSEIKNIKKLGIKKLFIIDPIFGSKKKRGKELLEIFNDIAPEIELLIFIRPEFLDDEYINILSKTNISEIRIGIQSLNPKIPKWLRSNNLKLVNQYLPKLSENHIPWRAELIVGLIGDTMEGLKETYKTVINDFNPTFLYGYHLTIIENTELKKRQNKIDEDEWIKADEKGSATESSSYNEAELNDMLVYSSMLTSLHRYLKSEEIEINIDISLLEKYIERVGGYSNKDNINFFLKAGYDEAENFWKENKFKLNNI